MNATNFRNPIVTAASPNKHKRQIAPKTYINNISAPFLKGGGGLSVLSKQTTENKYVNPSTSYIVSLWQYRVKHF